MFQPWLRQSLLFVTAVALIFSCGSVNAAEQFNGKVVNSSEGVLVLLVGEVQQPFVINDGTKIMLEGKPAKAHDLMPGHVARIVAELNGDQYIASVITARSSF